MNNLYYYLFPQQEGLCLPPCKGKKKGKKAKKKAKKTTSDTVSAFGDTANEIQDVVADNENNGGKSVCNPANVPSNGDIELLKGVMEISEQAFENVKNRNKLNDFYKEYEKSIHFNSNYNDNLIKKENKYYSYAFGEDNYNDLYNRRLLELNKNDLSENEIEQLLNDLSKQVYINSEISKNEKTLEKTKIELTNQKQKLKQDMYATENNIYVENRDNYYENDNLYTIKQTTDIITYIYILFFLLFSYIRLKNTTLPILYEICILIFIFLLPTFFYDNTIKFIQNTFL
tara:strand:+ start:85 stop:945 length:861 start_codon:yes stop_codon:yes gene_type:complete